MIYCTVNHIIKRVKLTRHQNVQKHEVFFGSFGHRWLFENSKKALSSDTEVQTACNGEKTAPKTEPGFRNRLLTDRPRHFFATSYSTAFDWLAGRGGNALVLGPF